MAYEKEEKKKKIAIVAISCILVVAVVIGVTVGINKTGTPAKASGSGEISTTNKAIKSICHPTEYKQICEESLNKVAGNVSDPKELVQASFQVAVTEIENAIKKSGTVKELAQDPMAKQAFDICMHVLDESIYDLKNSINSIGELDLSKLDEYVDDLRTWLSAALTYQQTCLEAFENTTGNAGGKMKEILTASTMLSTNGLDMVTDLSRIIKELNVPGISRRLLQADVAPKKNKGKGGRTSKSQAGLPSWVTEPQRALLVATPTTIKPNAVVAADGSGQFRTITEAVKTIPENSKTTFVLYIKEGVYKEQVLIPRTLTNVMIIGDGPTKTKITGSLNQAQGVPPYNSASFAVRGFFFIAKDIGFENTAGPRGHQAVALKVESDMSIFYNCQMDGYQDTVYAHSERQFYRDCTITGTIDFIFGNAKAVFQNCKIVVRKPGEDQSCPITAQGRTKAHEPTGFVIQSSFITADPEYYPIRFEQKSYLGRPWQANARVIFMDCQIDDLIAPEGWSPMHGNMGLDTAYFAEYNNRGPGAVQTNRVKWKSIKRIDPKQAASYTPGRFLAGNTWIPASGVPYASGFIKVRV